MSDWKTRGNAAFLKKDYPQALFCYEQALQETTGDASLQAQLYANRARVHLELRNYDLVDAECTLALETTQDNPKVWYRRGLAREQLGQLPDAEADFRQALQRLQNEKQTDAIHQMKRSVTIAAVRVARVLQGRSPESMGNGHSAVGSPPGNAPERPSPVQQKRIIEKLIPQSGLVDGEAYFLLDWDWWCDWWFSVGGVQGWPWEAPDPDEDQDDDEEPQLLGSIDNSHLLLDHTTSETQKSFFRDWYPGQTLQPNLVRGYHYELIPREVYAALQSWYGETTPSICRRVQQQRVQLYPPVVRPVPKEEAPCHACRRSHATMRCKRCMAVHYCQRSCQEAHWPFHKRQCQSQPTYTTGLVGLNNLGNTCFLNSALQSLRHATPLTRFFLSNQFRKDINTSNPLGTGGALANAYDAVLKELWMRPVASTSPTALKRAIAMVAPRFAGYLQHDAQEFLAYLLDGLHEDLNRIKKKPYVTMPDVGENRLIAGARAWEAVQRRDDSIVMDTFYGQFQSTCVCPQCNRVSVSYDAFNHVSLQIPSPYNADEVIPWSIFVVTQKNPIPVLYSIPLARNDTVESLKLGLSELCDIPATRLVICEVMNHVIVSLVPDKQSLSTMGSQQVLMAYEVDPIESSNCIHLTSYHTDVNDEGENEHPRCFGFPLLMSLSADSTCQELWDHVWSMVSHLVGESESPEDSKRELLQIHLRTAQGSRVEVFSCDDDGENVGGMLPSSEDEKTSILPRDLEQPLSAILGQQALESFLFFSLDWSVGSSQTDEDAKQGVDPLRFQHHEKHASYDETMRKHSAKVEIADRRVTLDKCFETFVKPERLDENNRWYCSECKEHVRALKTMELWKLPNILIVHLKRFEFKNALRRDKLDTLVSFPLDGLEMSSHLAPEKRAAGKAVDDSVPSTYDLFAVVNHYGRMGFGHYTAFAREWNEESMTKDWALYDDSGVQTLDEASHPKIVSPAAYVLFYRRRNFS